MSITVVIPAFNEETSLFRCLECIKNQNITLKKISIFLAVAKSDDNTLQIARKWRKENLYLFNDCRIINKKKVLWLQLGI